MKTSKKILYIDMDNVLVDFPSVFPHIDEETLKKYENDKDEIPGIFSHMKPVEGAIEAFHILSQKYDTYILSTSPWENPSAWSDKLLWIKKHLGGNREDPAYKRLILSHHKNLNKGEYLIDDREDNGAKDFEGDWLHFGKDGKYKTWKDILDYLA